jgi:glycosyltransferase involved in cell wall biosynthesis
MNPGLSVIIPTFQRTDSLKKLLDILLDQQMINIEIIVVDQNADNYFDDDMKAVLNRVKWVKLEKPNASAARNRGFLFSTAPNLLFIDDDLIPGNDFCRKGVDIFLNFAGIESFSPLVYTDEGTEAAVKSAKTKYLESWPGDDKVFVVTDTMSAAIFFKREFFLQTGGFDEFLFEFAKTAEDQELFLRMLRKGMKLWFVPFVKVYHDEKIPGGCDLRTADYWMTREKCMKAWSLGYRKREANGKIGMMNRIRLFRSCVLNLEVIRSSPVHIARQFSLMIKAIQESRIFFEKKHHEYVSRIKHGFVQQQEI